MIFASKGARIGAYIIDGIILWVILFFCFLISPVLGGLVSFIGQTLYSGITEGSGMHGTLGKYMLGIVVVDESGRPLDYGKSFTRAVCKLLSAFVLGIGYLIGLFDDEGKTLHDRIAGTRVITKASLGQPVYAAYGNQGMQQGPMNQSLGQPMPAANGAVQPKLVGVAGRYAGQVFLIGPQGLMMGRDQSACEFVFDSYSNGISRTHCKVQFQPQSGMFVIYDLGSTYGTYLGTGVRVPQGQPMTLRPGDQFYLADRGCMFMVSL